MFHFLTNLWHKRRLRQRISLSPRARGQPPAVLFGVPDFPISYAEAGGYLYLANGLMPLAKWDGIYHAALTAGLAAPATAPTLTPTGSGDISGTYYAYARWLDKDGNPSNLSPLSEAVVAEGHGGFSYTNVPLPDDDKVVTLQLLRNSAGQAITFYVDVETTDLTGTSFSSSRLDDDLALQFAVPLFDEAGNDLANRFGVPPNHKPFIVANQSRLFLAGEVPYDAGNCQVVYGSLSVTGVGTAWVQALSDRFLYVTGQPRPYQIASVDEANQVLTLTEAYQGPSDPFAVYEVRLPPAERRLVYFSEADSFDAWPPANAFGLEDNGDDITGLVVAESWIYILQRRHIHRLTYHVSPQEDGGVFLAATRGCVNQRCAVLVDGVLYLLDEQGVYRFRGGGEPESVSAPIQDLFWPQGSGSARINWQAARYFHAVHCREEGTVRWFVALDGSPYPAHALCYAYLSQAWWLENYPFGLGGSTEWKASPPRAIVAGPGKSVYALTGGTLDALQANWGTNRGSVSSATFLSLSDASASFAAAVAGAPVAIVTGRGQGQMRRIVGVTATRLSLDRPWSVLPDATSTYQLGGIPWRWLGSWYHWLRQERSTPRRIVLAFQPVASGQLDVLVYADVRGEPTVWGYDWPPTTAEGDGVQVTKGQPAVVVSLEQARGFAQVRLDDSQDTYVERPDLAAVELRGVGGDEGVRIYELTVEGAHQQ